MIFGKQKNYQAKSSLCKRRIYRCIIIWMVGWRRWKRLNKHWSALKIIVHLIFSTNFVWKSDGNLWHQLLWKKLPFLPLEEQDWMVWLTILKKVKTAQPVPESLALYTELEDSVPVSKANLLQAITLCTGNSTNWMFWFLCSVWLVFVYTNPWYKTKICQKNYNSDFRIALTCRD